MKRWIRRGLSPLYHQIDLLIRHRITSGHYADAEILPSEHALAEEFGVSRITIARALNNLAQGGLVKRRRGSGTAVTLPAAAEAAMGEYRAFEPHRVRPGAHDPAGGAGGTA